MASICPWAVDAPPEILLRLGVHDLHGRQGRADGGEKVLNGLALLEVGDGVGLAGGLLGGEATLQQEGPQLPADTQMGGGQLQMVALGRVGHRAARQKGPPKKGQAAVLLLQHGKVNMMGQSARRLMAERRPEGGQLVRLCDGENPLGRPLLRRAVKGELKGPVEQGGQPGGKGVGLGADAHL